MEHADTPCAAWTSKTNNIPDVRKLSQNPCLHEGTLGWARPD